MLVTPGDAGAPSRCRASRPNTNTVDRRHRRRTATRSSWTPAVSPPRHAAARHRGDGPLEQIKQRPGVLRRRRHRRSASTSPPRPTAPRCRTSWSDTETRRSPGPTLLSGYGGFEISRTPGYDGVLGPAVAGPRRHLRGGQHPRRRRVRPGWHTPGDAGRPAPGRTRTSPRSHEDLVRPRHHHRRPARRAGRQQRRPADGRHADPLPGAVRRAGRAACRCWTCAAIHLLLAGASWMAEYGDPDDPDDWAFISEYSPYQNVSAGPALSAVLITTSTRDDRVHPGHARKMAAALEAAGHERHLLREHRGRPRRGGRQRADGDSGPR